MSRVRPTRRSAARLRGSPAYSVRVTGVSGATEDVGLEEELEREAVVTAFGACTPFGHSLWQGRRFVGWFEPGDKRLPDEWLLQTAAELRPDAPR